MPVLDADGTLAGLVSEKDLLAATASAERWQQPLSTVMRSNVICYEEDTPIRVIYEFLCRVSLRGVVITKNGQPTGIVNRSSLLRCFHEWEADQEARPRRPLRLLLRPDVARQTWHLCQSPATRTALWQAGRWDKVVLVLLCDERWQSRRLPLAMALTVPRLTPSCLAISRCEMRPSRSIRRTSSTNAARNHRSAPPEIAAARVRHFSSWSSNSKAIRPIAGHRLHSDGLRVAQKVHNYNHSFGHFVPVCARVCHEFGISATFSWTSP